jgi:hypothetical protein
MQREGGEEVPGQGGVDASITHIQGAVMALS